VTELTFAQWGLLDRVGYGQLALTPANELMWLGTENPTTITGKENEDLRAIYRKGCITFPGTPYDKRTETVIVQLSELGIREQWAWLVFGPYRDTT
jgi:hypothetical protein